MTTTVSRGTLWALAGLLALAMIVPLASASPTPAFAPPNPGAPPQSWAYGANGGATASVTGTGTTSGGVSFGYQLQTHSYFSWNVIFTQTNTSATSFTINATRTVNAALFVEGCTPTCSSPVAQINITATAWETDNAWANFTTTGSVLLNGTTSVPAVALENEGITVAANLTGQANWQGRASSGNAYVSTAVQAQASAVFTPALGLFPMNMGVGQVWTSSSQFTAQGSYAKACHGYDSTVGTASCGSSGSISGSGTVALTGMDTGVGVTVNGHSYPFHVVTFELTNGVGNTYDFDQADGIFLLPHATNLLAPSPSTVSGTGSTSASGVNTDAVDMAPQGGHFGLAATKGELDSSVATSDLSDVTGGAGPLATVASAPAGAASVNPLVVQAAPESVACAAAGGCAAGPVSTPTHWGALVLVIGVVALAAVVVAVIAVRREGSGKGPTYPVPPPPVRTTSSAPGGTSGGNPSSSQDPLSNLW